MTTESNEEISVKLDKLILLSKEFDIVKEGILKGHGAPIKKKEKEIDDLFEVEKLMCLFKKKVQNFF